MHTIGSYFVDEKILVVSRAPFIKITLQKPEAVFCVMSSKKNLCQRQLCKIARLLKCSLKDLETFG